MMSLQEAIDYIRKVTPEGDPWTMWDIAGEDEPCHADKAIATILNAVVKGELTHVHAGVDWLKDPSAFVEDDEPDMRGADE